LSIYNNLVVKYSKSSNLEKSNNTSTINNPRKHNKQVSFISSTINLINLNNSDLISNILSNILKDFLWYPAASFRSLKQKFLIRSILLKVPYIIGILPINTRKSFSYFLISFLSISKVTIIIISLIGFKNDILRHTTNKFNILYSIYKNTKEFKNLTLINIKSITSKFFIFRVNILIDSNNLDRIIIKEYYLFISTGSYYNIMFCFKELLVLLI
jgi:hypothetical protein